MPADVVATRRFRTLRYATEAAPAVSLKTVAVDLLDFGNAVTIAVCIGIVAAAHATVFFAIQGAVPLAVPAVLCTVALASHYVNVLDDLGPQFLNDVPPVLRDADWGDDVWRPMLKLATAFGLCLGPSVWLWSLGTLAGQAAAVAIGLAGVFLFPAVLLTLVEGSAAANLDPRRLAGVIRISGRPYLTVVACFALACLLHAIAAWLVFASIDIIVGKNFLFGRAVPVLPWLGLTYAVVTLACYTGHLAMATLAQLYRRHHETFPWLLQRHERRPPSAGSTVPDGC